MRYKCSNFLWLLRLVAFHVFRKIWFFGSPHMRSKISAITRVSKATSINMRQITLVCWLVPWQLYECSTTLILVNLKVSCCMVCSLKNNTNNCWPYAHRDSSRKPTQCGTVSYCRASSCWHSAVLSSLFSVRKDCSVPPFSLCRAHQSCEPRFVYTMFILSYRRCIKERRWLLGACFSFLRHMLHSRILCFCVFRLNASPNVWTLSQKVVILTVAIVLQSHAVSVPRMCPQMCTQKLNSLTKWTVWFD